MEEAWAAAAQARGRGAPGSAGHSRPGSGDPDADPRYTASLLSSEDAALLRPHDNMTPAAGALAGGSEAPEVSQSLGQKKRLQRGAREDGEEVWVRRAGAPGGRGCPVAPELVLPGLSRASLAGPDVPVGP